MENKRLELFKPAVQGLDVPRTFPILLLNSIAFWLNRFCIFCVPAKLSAESNDPLQLRRTATPDCGWPGVPPLLNSNFLSGATAGLLNYSLAGACGIGAETATVPLLNSNFLL